MGTSGKMGPEVLGFPPQLGSTAQAQHRGHKERLILKFHVDMNSAWLRGTCMGRCIGLKGTEWQTVGRAGQESPRKTGADCSQCCTMSGVQLV